MMLNVKYTVSQNDQNRTIITTKIFKRGGDLLTQLGGEIAEQSPSEEKIKLSLNKQGQMLVGWLNQAFAKATKVTNSEL